MEAYSTPPRRLSPSVYLVRFFPCSLGNTACLWWNMSVQAISPVLIVDRYAVGLIRWRCELRRDEAGSPARNSAN